MRNILIGLLLTAAFPAWAMDFDRDGTEDQVITTCPEDDPEGECMVSVSLGSGMTVEVMAGKTIDYGMVRLYAGQADADRKVGQPILRIDEVSFGVGPNGAYPALDAITTSMLSRVPPHQIDVRAANQLDLDFSVTEQELVTFGGSLPGFGTVRVVVVAHPLFGVASPWVIVTPIGDVIASGRSMDFPRIYPGDGRMTIIDARLDGLLVYRVPRS